MYVSASSTGMGVALNAPAIVRKHLFCMTASLFEMPFDFFMSFGVCHMVEPYVMAGRTTAVYTWRAFGKVAPHVEVELFVSALDCFVNFFWIFLTCGPHFNFVSIRSPKILMSVFGSMLLFLF